MLQCIDSLPFIHYMQPILLSLHGKYKLSRLLVHWEYFLKASNRIEEEIALLSYECCLFPLSSRIYMFILLRTSIRVFSWLDFIFSSFSPGNSCADVVFGAGKGPASQSIEDNRNVQALYRVSEGAPHIFSLFLFSLLQATAVSCSNPRLLCLSGWVIIVFVASFEDFEDFWRMLDLLICFSYFLFYLLFEHLLMVAQESLHNTETWTTLKSRHVFLHISLLPNITKRYALCSPCWDSHWRCRKRQKEREITTFYIAVNFRFLLSLQLYCREVVLGKPIRLVRLCGRSVRHCSV